MKSNMENTLPLNKMERQDLQEPRLLERIIQKTELKKESQNPTSKRHFLSKNVLGVSLILQIIRRYSKAKDMNTGQPNII